MSEPNNEISLTGERCSSNTLTHFHVFHISNAQRVVGACAQWHFGAFQRVFPERNTKSQALLHMNTHTHT